MAVTPFLKVQDSSVRATTDLPFSPHHSLQDEDPNKASFSVRRNPMNQSRSSVGRLLAGRSTSQCRRFLGSTRLVEARPLHYGLFQRSGSVLETARISLPVWQRPTPFRSYTNQPLRTLADSVPAPSLPDFVLIRAPTPFQAFVKPVLFTVATSFGVFVLAAFVWEHRMSTILTRILASRSQPINGMPSPREILQAHTEILQERWNGVWERSQWIQKIGIPPEIQKMLFMMKSRWMELSTSERTIWTIIGMNSVVFAAWQVPRLSSFMHKWFLHNPASGRSITLLTSMFSHQHFWHFALNMFALHSFAVPLLSEHMAQEQFVAFYTTTGVVSSLVSHLFTAARVPWAKIIPSLGASGAIFGCVSATAYMQPDVSVFIIFLPFFPIKIPVALGALMGLDLFGILRGWRMFDHYVSESGRSFESS